MGWKTSMKHFKLWQTGVFLLSTCEEPDGGQIGGGHCVVDQILAQKVSQGVDEGEEGRSVEGLVLEVECT